ncbi:hypothetical protein AAFC00_007092 [Neodothiora populina]|uniref:protein kinase C n=1 Tax=Neodothiora populina TaxID=2781224 RepID=A0ABR3PC68_9PEZI
MSATDDATISDLLRKIDREKMLINAANQMRQATNNSSVNSRIDSQVRDARRNLQYFEKTLQELQTRKLGGDMGSMSLDSGNGAPPTPAHGVPTQSSGYPDTPAEASGYGAPGPGGYSMGGGNGLMPPRAPYAPPAPGPGAKGRPNYSRLDLIKAETPHLGPRIQLMLSQLEFKLSVEKQYKDGIEKMVRLYQLEGDRKSRAEAEGRRIESSQKIQLLKQALKRHEDLHVDIGADMQDDDSLNMPSQRKPLSGHLQIRVQAVADVDHAATGRFSRGPETFVMMKVEDSFKGRTKATRTDRWIDEMHEFDIDKANEIELTVYDKAGDHPTPVGMLWIRISDIAEEMRRKRIESEFKNSGWMSADHMDEGNSPGGGSGAGAGAGAGGPGSRPDMPQFQPPPGAQAAAPGAAPGGPVPQTHPQIIDDWFSLEPVGKIKLALTFVKQSNKQQPFDAGLGRKGAIRQRKEEAIEQYGHKFVQQTFYNIMRCALCGDFLKYTAGMQCADCRLTCHKKCYSNVVTKCISKSNNESDPDEEKINHRIPHRFEPFSNMGANWCCHCGYMLTLGRKQARKCNECGLTCHVNCIHFVPDFCGMSMERLTDIMGEIKKTKGRQQTSVSGTTSMANRTLRPASARPAAHQSQPSFSLSAGGQEQVATPQDRPLSYGKDRLSENYDAPGNRNSQYASQTSVDAAGAARASYPTTPSSPEPRPPPAQRAYSSQSAAAAAAAALSGKRTSAPEQQRPAPYQRQSTDYSSQNQNRSSGPPSTDPVYSQRNSQASPPPQGYNPADYAAVSGFPVQPLSQPPSQPSASQTARAAQYAGQGPQSPSTAVTPASPQAKTSANVVPPAGRKAAGQQGSNVRVGLDHFNFLAVLGKGNFGKVMLAETKTSKQLYAIKVLKKEFIIENDEVESTRSEKRVFLIANKERHPFLLSLHACFQTETRIYFVMEYISGGDLMLHIQRGQFGTKRAQFYAAEVCLALKYFHENGVIYRDLKLDNIMLTLDGHIKVADYGLCKEDMWYGSTTSTFCGTPEFMAPEILLDKKYGRAVDWWAFGVLIYQMLLQQSPFRGEDEDEIYDAILADEPLYPIHMPRDSVSILQKLLTREPELRLGSGPTDAQEIMSHAFFKNVNWEDIYHKRVPAPFLPQVKSKTDTSNFDSEFTSVTPVLTPVQSVLTQAMQEEFRGFSYTAEFQ